MVEGALREPKVGDHVAHSDLPVTPAALLAKASEGLCRVYAYTLSAGEAAELSETLELRWYKEEEIPRTQVAGLAVESCNFTSHPEIIYDRTFCSEMYLFDSRAE